MSFEFGVDIAIKPKNQDKIIQNIVIASLHTYGNAHILLLLENIPGNRDAFKHFIEEIFKQKLPGFDYDVVVATKINVPLLQIQKHGVYKFYQENHSDFKQYIRDNTVIITSGYALQAITEDDNLSIECFYDYIFNKTYFFAPQTCTYIFPIDSFATTLMQWMDYCYLPTDCSRKEFMNYQFRYIKEHYDFLSKQPPIQRTQIVEVYNHNGWEDVYAISKGYAKVSKD